MNKYLTPPPVNPDFSNYLKEEFDKYYQPIDDGQGDTNKNVALKNESNIFNKQQIVYNEEESSWTTPPLIVHHKVAGNLLELQAGSTNTPNKFQFYYNGMLQSSNKFYPSVNLKYVGPNNTEYSSGIDIRIPQSDWDVFKLAEYSIVTKKYIKEIVYPVAIGYNRLTQPVNEGTTSGRFSTNSLGGQYQNISLCFYSPISNGTNESSTYFTANGFALLQGSLKPLQIYVSFNNVDTINSTYGSKLFQCFDSDNKSYTLEVSNFRVEKFSFGNCFKVSFYLKIKDSSNNYPYFYLL